MDDLPSSADIISSMIKLVAQVLSCSSSCSSHRNKQVMRRSNRVAWKHVMHYKWILPLEVIIEEICIKQCLNKPRYPSCNRITNKRTMVLYTCIIRATLSWYAQWEWWHCKGSIVVRGGGSMVCKQSYLSKNGHSTAQWSSDKSSSECRRHGMHCNKRVINVRMLLLKEFH